MTEEEVFAALKREFSLPTTSEILSQAIHNILEGHETDREWIKANFSSLVENGESEAYRIYLEAERPAVGNALRTTFGRLLPNQATADDLFETIQGNFWALDRFFLSLAQGRKPRAGKAFEHIITHLFNTLRYPYSAQPVINGQPDFLLPSEDHYRVNAMDCIIFTLKRTLRERWRQIVTEGTRGHQFFLASLDKKVAKRDLPEMLDARVYLVVPESIRGEFYDGIVNVISFENFFRDHLDPAMNRWRASRVID